MEKIPFIVDFPILRRHKCILNKFIISLLFTYKNYFTNIFYSDTTVGPARHTHPKTSTFCSILRLGGGRKRTPEMLVLG